MENKKLTAAERFAAMGERLKKDGRLQIEAAKVEISEKIYIAMQNSGVSEAELARRIGASRAYVNKVLQGNTNFTVESLVKIGVALDCELKLEFTENIKSDASFASDVTYVEVEKPIENPKVISKQEIFKSNNFFDFAGFMENKKLKVSVDQNEQIKKSEKQNAAV